MVSAKRVDFVLFLLRARRSAPAPWSRAVPVNYDWRSVRHHGWLLNQDAVDHGFRLQQQAQTFRNVILDFGASDSEQERSPKVTFPHNRVSVLRQIESLGQNHCLMDQVKLVIQTDARFVFWMDFTRK